MSDSVQNVKDEDVLSSVRKLVSAEERPETPAEDTWSAGENKTLTDTSPRLQGSGPRLVLKPSQRVTEAAEEAPANHKDEGGPDQGSEAALSSETGAPLPWHDIDIEPELPQEDAPPPSGPDQMIEAAAVTAPAADQDTDDDAHWFTPDSIADEKTLRDMVSEMVRQELQGALGERITRKVCKLVRREIQRALMDQGIR